MKEARKLNFANFAKALLPFGETIWEFWMVWSPEKHGVK